MPKIAAAIAEPLSKTDRIVVISNGGGNGSGAGASKISAFLELSCSDQSIAKAVELSSFDQLKTMEQSFGGERIDKPVNFFRHGGSGQWRDYFSAELYEKFLSENGTILLRLGYEL